MGELLNFQGVFRATKTTGFFRDPDNPGFGAKACHAVPDLASQVFGWHQVPGPNLPWFWGGSRCRMGADGNRKWCNSFRLDAAAAGAAAGAGDVDDGGGGAGDGAGDAGDGAFGVLDVIAV